MTRKSFPNFSQPRVIYSAGFLIALGQDVEITVRPTRKEHGQASIALLEPIALL
jgi:hypothetical protein